jgi:hypothetical protein
MNRSGIGGSTAPTSLHYVRPNPPIIAPTSTVQNLPRPTHYHEPWAISNGRLPNAAPGQIILPPTSQARQAVSPDSGYRSLPSSSSDYQLPSPQTTTAPTSIFSSNPTPNGYKPITTQSNHISSNQKPSGQVPKITQKSEELLLQINQLQLNSIPISKPFISNYTRSLPISASEYQFPKIQSLNHISSVPTSKSYSNGFKSLPTSTSNYKSPIVNNSKLPITPTSSNTNFYRSIPISNSEYQFLNSKINNIRSNLVPHSKSFTGYNSLPSSIPEHPITTISSMINDGYNSLPSPTSSSPNTTFTNPIVEIREKTTVLTRRLSLPDASSLPLLLRSPKTSSTFHGTPLQPPPPPPAPPENKPPRRPTSIYLKGGSFHLPSTAVPPTSPWPGSLCPPPPPTPKNGYQVVDHKVNLFLEIMDSQQRFSKVSYFYILDNF